MAAENGSARDPLTLFRDLAERPHAYGFFQALRLLECAYPDKPRIGTSKRLKDDAIRFGQAPSLSFAPSTLQGFSLPEGEHPAKLIVNFFGLMGANGPLPLHLTEYARERQRNVGDATFVRFLDMFHHRLLALFYRAWADAQPTVNLDRPQTDVFGKRVASLAGYGMATLRDRDDAADYTKIAHVGIFSRQVRNAEGLALVLANYFRVPVQIRQHQPHWMSLPQDGQTSLIKGAINAQLGVTAVAGERVWDCQSKFRIILGPLSLKDYERFLPGRVSFRRLSDWVKSYVGFEFHWDLQLVLKQEQVPMLWLGNSAYLGWTTWLGVRQQQDDAEDFVRSCDERPELLDAA